MKITKIILALTLLSTPALAQEDNAAKLELAREAIQVSQVTKMFDNLVEQMKQMAFQQISLPESASPEQRKRSEELLGKIMDLSMGEFKIMLQKMDAIYAEVYTEDELRAMVAFFKSPEGQSMMAKQPQIMAKVIPIAQKMQSRMIPKVKQLIEEAKADMDTAKAE